MITVKPHSSGFPIIAYMRYFYTGMDHTACNTVTIKYVASTFCLQGDEYDDILKDAYKSVFFLSYYVREDTVEYRNFIRAVKEGSKRHFGYIYGEEEEVSRTIV